MKKYILNLITLNAGFKADNGVVFKTEFGGCNRGFLNKKASRSSSWCFLAVMPKFTLNKVSSMNDFLEVV